MSRIQNRIGAIYVIEAVIAAFILLFFMLVLTQAPLLDSGTEVRDKTPHVIDTLDTAGEIADPAHRQDVDALASLIRDHVPHRQIEVALLTVNSTTGEPSIFADYSRTFDVTETTESAVLRVWYRDATAPNISINQEPVLNNTGTVQDEQARTDISDLVEPGENTLHIDVADTSQIGYSIEVYDRIRSGTPPPGVNVFTSTHLLTGTNTSFQPVEVTVLAW